MDVMTDECVKTVSGYSFLALYITLVFTLNSNEVCHYGQNYDLNIQ